MARHNTHHAFTWADRAGTVRTGQYHLVIGLVTTHVTFDTNHILRGNTVSNSNTETNTGIGRFHNTVCRKRWWYKDYTGIGTGRFHRFFHGVENRFIQMLGTALAWRYTADNIGTVFNHVSCVEGANLTREALYQDFCLFS